MSLWKAVQSATWSEPEAAAPKGTPPPYKSFREEHRPGLRFHYRAIEHLLNQVLQQEAFWDIFFEHTGIKPILVLYENFAGDYETSTIRLLERLGLPGPDTGSLSPPLKQQSDSVNDDWVRRYSDIKLGAEFDLIPALVLPSSDSVAWREEDSLDSA